MSEEIPNTSVKDTKEAQWFSRKQVIRYIRFVCVLGVLVVVARILSNSGYAHTGLFYILLPACIGITMMYSAGPQAVAKDYLAAMRQNLFWSTALMLASAGVLQEGWICVLMFMPIFYLFWFIGYLAENFFHYRDRKKRNKVGSFVVPAVVLLLSSEGVFPQTTFERYQIVQHSIVTDQNQAELKANLIRPLEFSGTRHWFLKLFPLPDSIAAGSLEEGDVHKLDFTYWRWFFTNEHKGSLYVKLKEVSENRITTEIVKNTSFYARYLDIKNTRIDFDPLSNGKTKVTLHIGYERKLDPYWYFGPMQHFAMNKAAEVIVNDIIVGADND